MNEWLWAAAALAAALLPLAWVCARRPPTEGIVAVEAAGTDAVLVLLLVAEGTHRQPFGDLAIVLAAASFAGVLAFLRLIERGL
jgi:multisubunit Na+/H+ antiporter MnhF subunit